MMKVFMVSMLLPSLTLAEMVVFNISQGLGEDDANNASGFEIRCKTNQYCFFRGEWLIRSAKWGNEEYIESDTRLRTLGDGYRWLVEDWPYFGIICEESGGNCTALCSAHSTNACVCKTGIRYHGDFLPDTLVDCPVLERLPNATVPVPDDLIAYKSSVNDTAAHVELRCYGEFAACLAVGFADESPRPAEGNCTWATDVSRCLVAGHCLIHCDERCTCFDNVTEISTGRACEVYRPTDSGSIQRMTSTMVIWFLTFLSLFYMNGSN